MKIKLIIDKSIGKNEITLTCYEVDKTIERITRYIEEIDISFIGYTNNSDVIVESSEILYFESVDKKTFFYTKSSVLFSKSKLYEIEEKLNGISFVRISKSLIINLNKVKSINPLINRNLSIEMKNGEFLICSRRYVKNLKQSLGMR